MARPFLIEYEGSYYYITSSGNEQKAIFKSKKNKEEFLEYLNSVTKRHKALICRNRDLI